MKINVSSWPLALVLDFLTDYRGYISITDSIVWLTYYKTPKVA